MQVYTAQNIHQLDWQGYPEGDYARNYLLPLIEKGASRFMSNAHCEVEALGVPGTPVPTCPGLFQTH
jgi:hypothetical protein